MSLVTDNPWPDIVGQLRLQIIDLKGQSTIKDEVIAEQEITIRDLKGELESSRDTRNQ